MNKIQILQLIYEEARKMIGEPLTYLTGNNTATITGVENEVIRLSRDGGEFTLSAHMIDLYAKELAKGNPVHITNAVGDSYSARSALEACVAHMSHSGHIMNGNFAGRRGKHVVWFDQEIKSRGTLLSVADNWMDLSGRSSETSSVSFADTNAARSLLTKPFLILTGPSGTGKTRGAVRLADSVCGAKAHSLVAVGADWTDNRHVLGYLNPLETFEVKNDDGEVEEVFPIYETTPILDLILHANEHCDEPHVLILDEMNLSHVERYFADFLSAMELEDKTDALKLHSAGMARSRTGEEIPGTIDFPTNLFVIGTVNIDETTYMFSPKVLDRANVIEIHAGETAMDNFLKDVESGGAGEVGKDYGIPFLEAARAIQGERENGEVPGLPTGVRDAAAGHLMALFRIMSKGRAEFGFRTGKEVKAYLRTAHFLAGPDPSKGAAWAKVAESEGKENGDWMNALDAQILQKILPKLHGSRTRLAPLLGALATYCATGLEDYAMEHFPKDGALPKRGLKDAGGAAPQKFPDSYKKLERMIAVLVEEQFVSFIC